MKLKIGSRDSRLAVIQAQMLIRQIQKHTDCEIELVTMATTGDKDLKRPLDAFERDDFFVKELDDTLLSGAVDLTVHSYKDMPVDIDARIPIVAVSPREDPRDSLVFPAGTHELAPGKPIGCSSRRRSLQIRALIPACNIERIRGNVLARLDMLDEGQYAALVLANAGLKRLGIAERISRSFSIAEMMPAACQGIIAVQARADFDRDILRCFHDADAWDAAEAERAFIRTLDRRFSASAAAYCQVTEGDIWLQGLLGTSDNQIKRAQIRGDRKLAKELGTQLARQMQEGGDCQCS